VPPPRLAFGPPSRPSTPCLPCNTSLMSPRAPAPPYIAAFWTSNQPMSQLIAPSCGRCSAVWASMAACLLLYSRFTLPPALQTLVTSVCYLCSPMSLDTGCVHLISLMWLE